MGKQRVPAAALILLVTSSGCASAPVPRACPLIGYLTVIPVQISGSRAGLVAAVQVCSEEQDCSKGVPAGPPLEASVPPAPPTPPASLSDATPAPPDDGSAGPFSHFITSRNDQENWQIQTDMVTATEVTAQALDVDGMVLVRDEVALEWTRISGSEQCCGDSRSTPILLDTDQ